MFRSWAKKVVKMACSKTKMKKKDQMVLLMKEHRLRHKPELKLNKLLCKNKLKQRDKKKKEKGGKKEKSIIKRRRRENERRLITCLGRTTHERANGTRRITNDAIIIRRNVKITRHVDGRTKKCPTYP